MSETPWPHQPVLLQEVLEAFESKQLKIFLDGTLGAGGHSVAILNAHPELLNLYGVDQDPSARALAQGRLASFGDRISILSGNYRKMKDLLESEGVGQVDGILLDIGVSSMHFDQGDRGFSFGQEGPLDMRMNPEEGETAADLLNELSEEELGRIFREYGEERWWRRVARKVVAARSEEPFEGTLQLVQVLQRVLGYPRKGQIHPATRVFQALRIAVNDELGALEEGLDQALELLAPGGRLAVITFHSLEDRIVKWRFREWAKDKAEGFDSLGRYIPKEPLVQIITRKPLVANEEEVSQNPRSRSAKLRVIEKS